MTSLINNSNIENKF